MRGQRDTRPALTTPQLLVAALKNDNMLWRMHAQRLLVTRGQKDVVPALSELVRDKGVDEIGLNPAAIHALWTLHGLGALAGSDGQAIDAALAALKHPSAGVRRAAAMVLPRNQTSLDALLSSKLLDDPDAQVRLAALLAVSEMPPSENAAAGVFTMLQDPRNAEDRWIPDAATTAAARNDAGFISALLSKYKPAARAATAESPNNILPNSSFEEQRDGRPVGWRTTTHSGRGEFAVADLGHTGSHSAKISSEQGGDVSWSAQVGVKPRTDYRLTGWIKTENVRKVGGANGAMLNVHELQDPVRGGTKALLGDNDWTQVQLDFNSGEMKQITINCLFGGWGRTTGTAWFDDIELIPASGSGRDRSRSALGDDALCSARPRREHYSNVGRVESRCSFSRGARARRTRCRLAARHFAPHRRHRKTDSRPSDAGAAGIGSRPLARSGSTLGPDRHLWREHLRHH